MMAHSPNEWRDIPGYGGAYQINYDGEVRTWRWRGTQFSKKPRPMAAYLRGRGKKSRRRYVKLTDENGMAKEVAVLRIMVDVWLSGGMPGLTPYHKNGDLSDSCVNNIGFTTREQLGKMTGAKSKRRPVVKVDANKQIVDVYTSAREAGRCNFISYQAVIDRCHGRVKNPYALDGHTYMYDDVERGAYDFYNRQAA